MTFQNKLKNFRNSLKENLPWKDNDHVWKEFLAEDVPILWITGPLFSGKTSLAHFLSENSNFRLLHVKRVTPPHCEPTTEEIKEIIPLLKEEIKDSFKFCAGFIIDDFPPKMSEFRKFENKIGEPAMIVYIANSLDGTLGRALVENPSADLNEVRMQYVRDLKFSEKLLRRYTKKKKAFKVFSQYPIHDIHVKVTEHLESELAHKFRQIHL